MPNDHRSAQPREVLAQIADLKLEISNLRVSIDRNKILLSEAFKNLENAAADRDQLITKKGLIWRRFSKLRQVQARSKNIALEVAGLRSVIAGEESLLAEAVKKLESATSSLPMIWRTF